MRFLTTLFLLAFSVGVTHAGVLSCPDNTCPVFPIVGASSGTSTSCGNASVTATTAFAATPGKGTVPTSLLSSFLGLNLSSLGGLTYTATEGSAVLFAGFNVSPGSTISFSWEGIFEEGGTGSLFYIPNGSLVVIGPDRSDW